MKEEANRLLIRKLSEGSLYYFLENVWGIPFMGQLHRDMAAHVERPSKRKIFIAPREHMKTSVVTIGGGSWRALKNSNLRIQVSNAKLENSQAIVGKISRAFERNHVMRAVWNDVIWENPERDCKKAGLLWNKDAITLRRTGDFDPTEATFEAASLDSSDTSKHFDILAKDDLQNELNSVTQVQRQRVIDWDEGSESLMSFDSEEWNMLTRWHLGDYTGHKLEEYPDMYDVFHRSCYTDKTMSAPIWPERFTMELLAAKRRRLGDYKFACQMLNNPLESGATPFKKEFFQEWTKIPEPRYVVGAVDAAQGLNNGDFTVVMVGCYGVDGSLYILEYDRGHYSPRDTVDIVFRLAKKWGVKVWGLEPYTYERILFDYLRTEQTKRNEWLNVTEVKRSATERSKQDHIQSLLPRYQTKTIFHAPGMRELEEEAKTWPFSVNDDLLDVMADLLLLSAPVMQPREKKDYSQMQDGYIWEAHDKFWAAKARQARGARTLVDFTV